MFSNNILPYLERKNAEELDDIIKTDSSFKTTRECFFGLSDEDVKSDTELLKVCEPLEFLTLLKNQPMYYISIIEFNIDAKQIAESFDFFVSRNEMNNNLIIAYKFPEDAKTDTINFNESYTDSEIIDNFNMHLKSKFEISKNNITTSNKQKMKPKPKITPSKNNTIPNQINTTANQNNVTHNQTNQFSDLFLLNQKLDLIINQNNTILYKLCSAN